MRSQLISLLMGLTSVPETLLTLGLTHLDIGTCEVLGIDEVSAVIDILDILIQNQLLSGNPAQRLLVIRVVIRAHRVLQKSRVSLHRFDRFPIKYFEQLTHLFLSLVIIVGALL